MSIPSSPSTRVFIAVAIVVPLVALTVALAQVALSSGESAITVAADPGPQTGETQASVPGAVASGEPAQSPLVEAQPVSETGPRQGEIVSRLRAGSYSYLEVRFAGEARAEWLAVLGEGLEPGRTVRATVFAERAPFHSARLDRDFERILFATLQPVSDTAVTSAMPTP